MMTLSGQYWDGEEGGPDYNPIERIEHGLKYLRSREFEREVSSTGAGSMGHSS